MARGVRNTSTRAAGARGRGRQPRLHPRLQPLKHGTAHACAPTARPAHHALPTARAASWTSMATGRWTPRSSCWCVRVCVAHCAVKIHVRVAHMGVAHLLAHTRGARGRARACRRSGSCAVPEPRGSSVGAACQAAVHTRTRRCIACAQVMDQLRSMSHVQSTSARQPSHNSECVCVGGGVGSGGPACLQALQPHTTPHSCTRFRAAPRVSLLAGSRACVRARVQG